MLAYFELVLEKSIDNMLCCRLKSTSDLQKLRELNALHEEQLVKNYPFHQNWINKALREIESGNRIALGVFNGEELIGSVIIKYGLSNDIELKNFIVTRLHENESEDSGISINEIRTTILDHVEKFSQKNGYETCNIDIVTKDLEEINFFLNNGFIVSHLKQYPKRKKYSLYSLTKNVSPIYNADPLDFKRMVEWILRYNYNFQITDFKPHNIDSNGNDYCFGIFKFQLSSSNIKSNYNIKGEAIIDECSEKKLSDKSIESIKKVFDKETDIKLFFSYVTNDKLKQFGVKSYNLKDVKGILGKASSCHKMPFSQIDIGGLLYFSDTRFEEIIKKHRQSIFHNRTFLLYLIDGYGNSLKIGNKVFFSKYDLKTNEPKVWGYSEINGIFSGNLDIVTKHFRNKSAVLKNSWGNPEDFYSSQDWSFYTSFLQGISSEDNIIAEITVLNMNPIVYLNQGINPIPYVNKKLHDYIQNEFNEFVIDTSYIDYKSAEEILNHIKNGDSKINFVNPS